MDYFNFLIIPGFYLLLFVCLYFGVLGAIRKSIPQLLISSILGLVCAYLSTWSIGRYVVVIPILAVFLAVFFFLKNGRKNGG